MSNLINTSIITDRIGRQEVLLSINPAQLWQNLINQTGDTFSWNWATDNSAKCTTTAQVLSTDIGMTCQLSYDTVQLQAWLVHCPLGAQIELVITEHVREFCDCFDLLWNCLQHLKKTATRPDLIPFWVWRDHAEIFTRLMCGIWNLSLTFSTWPSS